MRFTVTKHNGVLVPLFESDVKAFKSMEHGEYAYVEVTKKKRNIKHHNLFFKRLQMIYDNCEHNYPSVESLRNHFIVLSGYVNEYKGKDGETRIEAKSISFKSMGEQEFTKFETVFLKQLDKYFNADLLKHVEDELNNFKT